MCADYTTTHHEQPLSCVDHRGRQRRACTCARTRAAWATLAMHLSPRRRAVYGASCNPVRPRTRGLGAGSDFFFEYTYAHTYVNLFLVKLGVCPPAAHADQKLARSRTCESHGCRLAVRAWRRLRVRSTPQQPVHVNL